MPVIIGDTDIVLEPPKAQQTSPQAAAGQKPGDRSRLRPEDLAHIHKQQRRRMLRVRAD